MGAPAPRLLLDQGLPRDSVIGLRASGLDAAHVGELGMFAATDLEIIAWARERGYVVVTLDADFHAILAVRGATKPSVIRLRLEGLREQKVCELLSHLLPRYATELANGCLLTVKQNKTTCHLLTARG